MDSEYAMGFQLTTELLEEGASFTAVAGQNDMMAIGAIDALRKARLHVPKMLSVIGCDNIFLLQELRGISLTTDFNYFVALKGRDACDIIIRKIDTAGKFYMDTQPTSLSTAFYYL